MSRISAIRHIIYFLRTAYTLGHLKIIHQPAFGDRCLILGQRDGSQYTND